jgi:2-oxoglutarate dehydrogenase E2 component (dihydrolipoamide succinyltransferase)
VSVEIRVPQLPESVAEATLAAWHKEVGQQVRRDENLGDLETDKVMLEIPAPSSGVLREIKVQPGTAVKSGALLALIDETATAAEAGVQPAAPAATAVSAATAPTATAPAAGAPTAAAPAAAAPAPAAPAPTAAAPRPASAATAARPAPASTAAGGTSARTGPAARRVIEENQLGAAAVSGRAGRITKEDAVAAASASAAGRGRAAQAPLASSPAAPPAPQPPAAAVAPGAAVPAVSAVPAAVTGRPEERVPMSRLRARIAERLLQAQATQALLTTFNEVDLTAVQELRARYREVFEKQHGVKLGLMSFFVKAAIEALRRFPVVNATIDGAEIVYHDYFDIGVAVSTERGLMVPVLRNADAMGFAEIEQHIAQYATRARDGSITLEELTGGTFSITNGGIFGSLMSTPIVNTPQSAILGMHKIQDRPMVVGGQIVVRPMMYLALTYDHRLIDGREAVQFLVTIKDCLEDPGRLLLSV